MAHIYPRRTRRPRYPSRLTFPGRPLIGHLAAWLIQGNLLLYDIARTKAGHMLVQVCWISPYQLLDSAAAPAVRLRRLAYSCLLVRFWPLRRNLNALLSLCLSWSNVELIAKPDSGVYHITFCASNRRTYLSLERYYSKHRGYKLPPFHHLHIHSSCSSKLHCIAYIYHFLTCYYRLSSFRLAAPYSSVSFLEDTKYPLCLRSAPILFATFAHPPVCLYALFALLFILGFRFDFVCSARLGSARLGAARRRDSLSVGASCWLCYIQRRGGGFTEERGTGWEWNGSEV